MNALKSVESMRKFPRKEFNRKIGVLFSGTYQVVNSIEISEGGLSFSSDFVFTKDQECVLTFKIPNGDFISLRGQIKHVEKVNGSLTMGVAFLQIPFSNKRQIRNFIADRTKLN